MGFYWSYTFLLKPSIRCTLALFSQHSTTLFLQLSLVSYCEHLTCSLNLIVETIQRSHPTSTLHDIINLSFNLQPVEFGEINQVLLHDQHYAVVMEIPAKEEGEEETAINLFGVLRS